MKRALFTGTFDPPTLGHLNIIERACMLCDHLIVGIGTNLSKSGQDLFSKDEKKSMLKAVTAGFSNVDVQLFTGLAVDFAKKNDVAFLIRGIRGPSDLEKEWTMALANKKMGGMETIFLMADPRFSHISSTFIREFGLYGRRLNDFVPSAIEDMVVKKISARQF